MSRVDRAEVLGSVLDIAEAKTQQLSPQSVRALRLRQPERERELAALKVNYELVINSVIAGVNYYTSGQLPENA